MTTNVILTWLKTDHSVTFLLVPGYRNEPGDCAAGFLSAHHTVPREACAGRCNALSHCQGWIWIGADNYCALKSPMCDSPVGVNSPKGFTAYYKLQHKGKHELVYGFVFCTLCLISKHRV